MADLSMEDVVQTLRNSLGARWDGGHDDGIDEMRRVLEHDMKMSSHDSAETVQGLLSAGTIRYREAEPTTRAGSDDLNMAPDGMAVPAAAPGVLGIGVPTSAGGPAVAPGLGGMAGYWQIGDDESAGRAGQVRVDS